MSGAPSGARGDGHDDGELLDPETRADAVTAIRRALEEDLRYGPDATSLATVPAEDRVTARLTSRSDGVVAGLPLIEMVLARVLGDGTDQSAGFTVTPPPPTATAWRRAGSWPRFRTHAGAATAERTLLNLVCHLSGWRPPPGRGRRGGRYRVRGARYAQDDAGARPCRSTRCAAAAASTTGWDSAMPS